MEFRDHANAEKEQWPYGRMASVFTDLFEDEYEIIWDNLLNPTSYLSSLDVQEVLELTKSQKLIVDCVLYGSYGINCSDITYFTWDSFYHTCHTIHVPENIAKVFDIRLFGFISKVTSNNNSCMKTLTIPPLHYTIEFIV